MIKLFNRPGPNQLHAGRSRIARFEQLEDRWLLAADLVAGVSTSATNDSTRVVVQLSDLDAASSVLQALPDEATSARTLEHLPFVILEVPESRLASLSEIDGVVSVQRDEAQPHALASAIPVTNVDEVHSRGFLGDGSPTSTVVIIDTGIDTVHPFFNDNSSNSRIVGERCFSTPSETDELSLCPNGQTTDTSADVDIANCYVGLFNICNHGTHVAGIAAGNTGGDPNNSTDQGVAPGANIIAIQAFTRFEDAADCGGAGAPCLLSYDTDQLLALNYVVGLTNNGNPMNIAAVNMSIGGGTNTTNCDTDIRKPAIDSLLDNDVATVIAAGNGSLNAGVSRPGCISTAFTVGSTDDSDAISGFSNRGALLDAFAPGSSIWSSVPGIIGYEFQSGTSMAAPHVAGALALLRDAHPDRAITDLMNDLTSTGVPITYSSGGGNVTTPRIDVHAAMGRDTDDQFSESQFISTSGTLSDQISEGTDVDMFRFTASAGSIVGFDIDRSDNEFDSVLRIFDSSGNEIASNDDGIGPGTEPSVRGSYVEHYFRQGGTYYAGVSGFGNSNYNPVSGHGDFTGSTGSYSLTLSSFSDGDRGTSNAAVVQIGDTVVGSISPSIDVDMRRFTVLPGQTVEFDLTVTSGALDGRLSLFDSGTLALLQSSNDLGSDTSFEYTFTTGGTYFIGVSDADNQGYDPFTGEGPSNHDFTETGDYSLTLNGSALTSIEVSTAIDENDGDQSVGDLSLREAIGLANLVPGPNTITFSSSHFSTAQTISLAGSALRITDDVKIDGPGPNLVAIDAQGNSQVFEIDDSNSATSLEVRVAGVTISGGAAVDGGGIVNDENLTIFNSVLSGNSASNDGGAIYNLPAGVLNVRDSTFVGNSATDDGGAIINEGQATITGSTFDQNNASGSGAGGGGIINGFGAIMTVENSTFSGNSAFLAGGGFANFGTATINQSTLSGNSSGSGGGIYNGNADDLTLNNTIVANSIAGGDLVNHPNGLLSGAFNHVADGNDYGLPYTYGGDPMLSALADNGGPTHTFRPLPGSPAINSGDPAAAPVATNAALFGMATQTSSHGSGNYPASNAIDGDLSTFSHTLLTEVDPSLTVDLGDEQFIDELVLHNRQDCCAARLRDITVQILDANDNEVFTSALLNPGNVLGSPASITVDTGGVSGRTVVVSRTSDPGGSSPAEQNVLSLSELEVRSISDQRGSRRVSGGILDIGAVEAHPAVVRDLGVIAEGVTDQPGQHQQAHEVFFFQFELTDNVTAAEGDALVIHTDESGPFPTSALGLFDAAGNLVASDDEGGTFGRSRLSFGTAGSDGDLNAGMHFLAVSRSGTIFGSANFDVTNPSSTFGTMVVTFELVSDAVVDPDFNDDGNLDGADIDLLQANIVTGPADPGAFDLTGDGQVTIADRDEWLIQAGAANLASGNAYLLGDANLDGHVDGQDFVAWNNHKFSANSAWTAGDFNVDGIVDGQDFVIWNNHKFSSADGIGRATDTNYAIAFDLQNANEPANDSEERRVHERQIDQLFAEFD